MTRATQFVQAFADVANASALDADVAAVVTERSVELFSPAEAGIVLAQPDGSLRAVASASAGGAVDAVGAIERRHRQGPSVDAQRSGAIVQCVDQDDARRRWPRFAPEAQRAGFRAFTAVPMRRQGHAIGALHLFSTEAVGPELDELPIVQALADLAALAVDPESADREAHVIAAQLQTALDARVVIEQAKGVVAARTGASIDNAFAAIRDYARGRRQLLTDVARRIVGGELDPTALTPYSRGPRGPRHPPITGRSGTPRGAR